MKPHLDRRPGSQAGIEKGHSRRHRRPETPSKGATLEDTKPPRQWRSHSRGTARVPDTPEPEVPRFEPPASPRFEPAQSPQSPGTDTHRDEVPSFRAGEDELPATHGVDRLVLMVRDPYWAFAWWELTPQTHEAGRAALQEASDLVLRLYDVTFVDWDGTNHHASLDVEISDLASNWYLNLAKPGGSFCAEIGLRTASGFSALLRSNFVTLPRDSVSSVIDEEWMSLEEDYAKLFELAGGKHFGAGSGEVLRMLEERLRVEMFSGWTSSYGALVGRQSKLSDS